jgi:hypothetical protein
MNLGFLAVPRVREARPWARLFNSFGVKRQNNRLSDKPPVLLAIRSAEGHIGDDVLRDGDAAKQLAPTMTEFVAGLIRQFFPLFFLFSSPCNSTSLMI